jgi:hypothetical protein
MPPADPSDRRWQVALPTGTEGPYSAAEIRDLVKAGRVKPDDHLTELVSQRSSLVREVVPYADDLAVGTERIRRRSGASDRQPAVKDATGSEIRRFRTPLPGAADAPASEPVAVPAPPAITPPPASRRRLHRLIAILLLTIAACAAVLLIWPYDASEDPGLQPYGVWSAEQFGPHRGPWRFAIAEDGISITGPDGSLFRSLGVVESPALHEVRVVLNTPHPLLGDRIGLAGSGSVTMTTAVGSCVTTPVR